jgi:hypothetical protein
LPPEPLPPEPLPPDGVPSGPVRHGRGAVPHLLATFVYDLPEDRWSWTPISVEAGSAGVLDVVTSRDPAGPSGGPGAPTDEGAYAEVAEHLESVVAAALSGDPVVYRGALLDADGVERDVLVLAESDRDDPGPLTGLRGFVFDLVAPRTTAVEDEVFELRVECDLLWQALRDADVVGQAKGVVMVRCGCTADVAGEVLEELAVRWGIGLREASTRLLRGAVSGQASVGDALGELGFSPER